MDTEFGTPPAFTAPGAAHGLGPVAVGTDGSATATTAVLWAAAEAARRDRSLTIVHATGSDTVRHITPDGAAFLLAEGERCLHEAHQEALARCPDVHVETVLSRGEAAESVLEAAGADGTAVMGSRGLGGFSALLLGSCSLRAAARTQVPLVVVRNAHGPDKGVVAVALRDDRDREALRFAARTARSRGAELRVVSGWMFLESVGSMVPMVDDIASLTDAEEGATRRSVAPVRREFPEVKIVEETVRTRSIAGTLVHASDQADLLVVGARRPAHPARAAFGGVTHALLHHARCPLAVVPHD
ncbi:universal stress protein [Actinacidiphila alni]|uniref:universal stress protein n=1 Tax=Actinacidiphila alni TaxID=380248 RepID=UPI0033FBA199